MSISKLVTGLLVFAKPEATYNAGATVATTDVIQIIEAYPVFNYVFAYNGDRKGATMDRRTTKKRCTKWSYISR